MRFGQRAPKDQGWKRYMTQPEAPREQEYSPYFQDEYQRLWHGAAAECERLREEVRQLRMRLDELGYTN